MPFRPPHKTQKLFLAKAHVLEVLFGGAAGGGKSVAALQAAAQFLDTPGYAALLLRSSFPDLMQPKALIPLSLDVWKSNPRAHWSAQERRWSFECAGGGTSSLTFGYLERDMDVYQYQGAAYQLILIDELTQHTEFRYRYLFSRLRRDKYGPLSRVPLRMRATSNPGGRGHTWVKNRFINPKTKTPGAMFIPSRLDDNPSLDRESYEASLSNLDPVTRRQLLDGDWDAITEGRFRRAWLRYYDRHGTSYRLGPNRFIDHPATLRERFLTVDSASTIKQTAGQDPDYTVISAWSFVEGQLLWLGCSIHRVEVPEIAPLVAKQYQTHQARKVYFRPSGMEKAVPQLCRRHLNPPMNVVELPTRGDKLQSAADALNLAEGGRLWLPNPDTGAAWPHTGNGFPHEDVRDNLLQFTGDDSGHDDIWDTFGIAGTVVELNGGGAGGVPMVIHH